MTTIGNYRIIKEIGVDKNGVPKGGFGRIYQAEHIILEEKACLKQNKYATPEDVALLQNEAKILWKLYENHSIPSVKDFFMINHNNGVMVISYIEGNTLEQIIEQNSRLHPEDVCWITERLLGALYYCHCNGVIHADIKPQNIFIEPDKRDIKVIDFGLSAFKPGSNSRALGYTPRYAAPEITQGKPPIPETDLYGVGMVMLYALGGDIEKKDFPIDTPKEITEFCSQFLRYDPIERPHWEKKDLLKELSDLRYAVFGRRHLK